VWILGPILGILIFLIIVLCVPVDLVFNIGKRDHIESRVRIGWLFGLIGKDISGRRKQAKVKVKVKKKKRKKRSFKPLLAVVRTRGLLKHFIRFIKDIIRRIKIRNLCVHLTLGLADPADTGFIFAAITPLVTFAGVQKPTIDINIQPDFEQENLQGYAEGGVRVYPIQFIRPLLLFIFSLTTLRAIRAIIRARRK
jgi:hypothetical protein